jgi:hypothetical protein
MSGAFTMKLFMNLFCRATRPVLVVPSQLRGPGKEWYNEVILSPLKGNYINRIVTNLVYATGLSGRRWVLTIKLLFGKRGRLAAWWIWLTPA